MTWSSKPLSEILVQSGRDRAGDQNLPLLSITMKKGLVDQAEKFKKRIASSDISNYRIAYRNELVVGFPIDEGVLGFQTKYPAGVVSPAYDVWKLQNEVDCHIPYLERYLRSAQARNSYASRMQGAVARRRSLTKTDFLNLKIPFPPINDQIRIAYLAGRVEELIDQRKQHLRILDALLASVFTKMFGDPVRNDKAWDILPCDRVVLEISSGTSYGGEDRPFESSEELGVLKISAVTKGEFDPNQFKVVSRAQITKVLRFVRRGDFLFSRANTAELVAACCIVPQDFDRLFLPDKLWAITLNKQLVNPQFFNYLLKNEGYRNVVRGLASGGHDSMLNISMQKFKTLDIPCPTFELQGKFAEIAYKVEALKISYRHSLIQLEALYGVVCQRAFKGQLDQSRLPFPEAPLTRDNEMISTQSPPQQPSSISLPETELLESALTDRDELKPLLEFWLISYAEQLGNRVFSVDEFMRSAEAHAEKAFPDREFELGAVAYDLIKAWVFDALSSRRLEQYYPSAEIRVALRRQHPTAES